jgi:hypothetical protein
MKSLKFLVVLSMVFGFGQAFADQGMGEKATDKVHDAKRDVKAKAHRAEEKACDKNDEKGYGDCMAKKAGNRASEAKDAVKDKSTETKNKVD